MKENLQQSLKKIKILEDRVEQLCQVKKKNEAIKKSKKLFHLATSFTVILLLNENYELFEELLGVTLRSWDTLMKLHANFTFNLNWKKQVLAFELLALIHAQKRKFKAGLKAIYSAQTIVSELDETSERNLDYIMAVNTLTGYLLLSIEKPQEALEFIMIAERIVYKLIETRKKESVRNSQADSNNPITSLEVIGEHGMQEQLISHNIKNETRRKIFGVHQGQEQEKYGQQKFYQRAEALNQNSDDGLGDFETKKSCLSPTLLSNYVLGISLLKNIAMKLSYADNFANKFENYMQSIKQVEQSLFQLGSVDCIAKQQSEQEEEFEQIFNGVAVSFLIKQHKIEILDNESLSFQDVISETFNKEFMNMLQVCIFVPFLHVETPKPHNVPKVAPIKDNVIPQAALIKDVLNLRVKIGAVQQAKKAEMKEIERQREVSLQDSIPENNNSLVVGQQLSIDSYDGQGSMDPDSIAHPVSFPIFSQNKQKQTIQHETRSGVHIVRQHQPRTTKNASMPRASKGHSPPVIKRGSVAAPRIYDVNQFASLVDPRQESQKRKTRPKLSVDRVSNYTKATVTTAANITESPKQHKRVFSLPHNTMDDRVSPQFQSKMQNLKNAVKGQNQPQINQHVQMMSQTMQTQQPNKSWVRPAKQDERLPAAVFPTLQPMRQTVTAGTIPATKRTRQNRGAGSVPPTTKQSDFTMINQQPVEQLLSDQRATEERMKLYKRGARQHDMNIERILNNPKNDWTSLYSHPKLMGQYYWKDDTIHTNKQRALEIKKVIQSGYGQLQIKSSILKKSEQSKSLLQPLERQSIQLKQNQPQQQQPQPQTQPGPQLQPEQE